MLFEKTPSGPPPPYTPNGMPQPRGPTPYGYPQFPHNTMPWNQAPGYPPQPVPAPYEPPHASYHPQQPYGQPQHQPHHQPYPPAPAPAPANMHPYPSPYQQPSVSYPYTPTAHRQMTLLSPDRTNPLFTVSYPSGWSTSPRMVVRRGGDATTGPEVGGALFHSLTTDKVDAWVVGAGMYRFRKRFESGTGLAGNGSSGQSGMGSGFGGLSSGLAAMFGSGGSGGGRRMEWSVEDGAMVLAEEGQGGKGGWIARFVASDGAKVGGSSSRLEGRLEIRRAGLTGQQFEEVFVTLVAEMERKRRNNEDLEILGEVVGGMGEGA